MMQKKDRERAILELVYDVARFDSVRDSESPDFELRYHNEEKYFGVEITEFYLCDSDARIKNIPATCLNCFLEAYPDTKTT